MPEQPALYGVMAEFEDADALLAAAHQVREAGYTRTDAYAPFPVDGLAEALGFRRSWLPLIVLIAALAGAGGGYFMMWYANVISYPWNVAGRPHHSWPAFIPITFEMAVLVAGFAAVIGMLALNGLPMPYHPVFNVERFSRASQDRFFLCVEAKDKLFDKEPTMRFLRELGALEVMEVPS